MFYQNSQFAANFKDHEKNCRDWLLTCDEQDNNFFNAFAKELV